MACRPRWEPPRLPSASGPSSKWGGAKAGWAAAPRADVVGKIVREDGMKRRDFLAGGAACTLAAISGQASAQSGPLTKIIFPFSAGGGGDALGRLLAQNMSLSLDRNIIVENRTGGDGLIGIKAAKAANPDGTTILVTTGPTMHLLPYDETQPTFDTARDFVPVSQLVRFEFCVVVGPA